MAGKEVKYLMEGSGIESLKIYKFIDSINFSLWVFFWY